MVLFVDYNTLKIKRKSNLAISDLIIHSNNFICADVIIHTPNGFYFDDTLTKSDDDWFNKFIETSEYKNYIRKIKLEKLYIK